MLATIRLQQQEQREGQPSAGAVPSGQDGEPRLVGARADGTACVDRQAFIPCCKPARQRCALP